MDLGYNTILKLHVPDMVAVGVRLEAIEAIRSGELQRLTEEERQIVDYTRQALNGEVTDSSFAAMVELPGERGALEFTARLLSCRCTPRPGRRSACPDVPDREIDELLESYKRGEGAVVSADARLG